MALPAGVVVSRPDAKTVDMKRMEFGQEADEILKTTALVSPKISQCSRTVTLRQLLAVLLGGRA